MTGFYGYTDAENGWIIIIAVQHSKLHTQKGFIIMQHALFQIETRSRKFFFIFLKSHLLQFESQYIFMTFGIFELQYEKSRTTNFITLK